MFRNSHNSRGSSLNAGNSAPRWRTVFMALVLALSIGSAGQIPPAQAASPDPTDISFELNVYPEKLTMLCGEEKTLYASVSKTMYKVINDKEFRLYAGPGLSPSVDGEVTGPKIGTLAKELVDLENMEDANDIQQIPFKFTANKPGTTTLKFSASINGSWIEPNVKLGQSAAKLLKEVSVQVNCKFKVKTRSRWTMPGIHAFDINAMIDNAVMKADEQGNFTGSATVNWAVATTVLSPVCISASFTVSPSQANLTGQMDESGLLVVNLPYQPAAASVTQVCRTPTGPFTSTYHYQLAPDPLRFSVPSSSGVFNQSQVLVATSDEMAGPWPLSGSSVIVVIPEEDEAVAFNADSRAALSPSPWWAMLGDDFPWPYNASLAVR